MESLGKQQEYCVLLLLPLMRRVLNPFAFSRDSFANIVDLLDDMFERAAAADEPIEMNYIKVR